MTTTKNLKLRPQYKLLPVRKDDGSVVNVARTPMAQMQELIDVQDRLLEKYVVADGALSTLLLQPDFVADLELACGLLPIAGKEDEYLSFDDIKENWEQLVHLFFNSNFDTETRIHGSITQPKVSQLNFLPYSEILNKHLANKVKAASTEES